MNNSKSNKTDYKKTLLKLLSAMLVVLMTLTLFAACSYNSNNNGDDNDVPNNSGNINDSNNDNNNDDNNNGANSGDSSQNTATITYSLKKASPFSDGVAYVTLVETRVIDGNTTTEEYQAIIDTDGKILHKFSPEELKGAPLNYELKFYNGVTYNEYNNTIYDKSFNVIASPESKGYDTVAPSGWLFGKPYIHDCGYFLVYKTEEAFTGDKCFVGVLDTNGNYTVPLSDTHPIAQIMCENNYTFKNFDIEYIGDGYYELEYGGYYNILTNKITPDYPHYEYNTPSYGDFSIIDENGNYTTLPEGDYQHICDNYYLYSPEEPSIYNGYSRTEAKLADVSSGSVLIDFGNYKLYSSDTASYHNGYFLSLVKNDQGAIYCCLFDRNGEPAFDPIRMENNVSDTIYGLTDEGFIIKKDGIFYFYDYEGNSVAYDPQTDNTAMRGYSDGWALIMIERENWQYEYVFVNSKGESMF